MARSPTRIGGYNNIIDGTHVIQQVASTIFARMEEHRAPQVVDRVFKSIFGCSLFISHVLWNYLLVHAYLPREIQIKHMLWALCFLKQYPTEDQMAAWFAADRNTVRKYIWLALTKISSLHHVLVCF